MSQRPSMYVDIESMIAERVPRMRTVERQITHGQAALVAQVASDTQTHESVRLIFNLAVNDLLDLLHDLNSGSGRSAMRAARAVIEHAINLYSVTGSLAEAHRYADHLDQGPTIMGTLAPGADRLEKGARRAYKHVLNTSGAEASRRFTAAVAEHGPWFKRGWTQGNLKERADSLGVGYLYDYYKLASLVTHGSAGGSLGSIKDHSAGFRIYRTGHSLELAPVAFLAGLFGYREVLQALQRVRTDIEIAAYSAGLNALDDLWPDYFTAIMEIDRALWPSERVRPPRAILAFNQNKSRRWYLHLPMTACLIRAKDPDLSETIESQVSEVIELVITEHRALFRPDQRWLTAEMPHVTVTPADGARPIPDSAFLEVPPDGHIWRKM